MAVSSLRFGFTRAIALAGRISKPDSTGWVDVGPIVDCSHCVNRMACLRSSAVICFQTISTFCLRGPFSGSERRARAK